MRVVPAWFCTPSKVMRKLRAPTMLVTTPSRLPEHFQLRPLLDMRFQVAAIARRIDRRPRPPGQPGALQRVAQRRAVVAVVAGVELRLVHQAAERAAAEERAVMPLLVRPAGDVDAAAQGARHLQAVDHAHRAIQPAGMRLGLQMAADQQERPLPSPAADDVADAVDLGVEPGLGQPGGEPVPRLDVVRRIGRAVHPGAIGADRPQRRAGRSSSRLLVDPAHGATAMPCGRISPSGVGTKPETLSLSAHSHLAWYSTMCGRSCRYDVHHLAIRRLARRHVGHATRLGQQRVEGGVAIFAPVQEAVALQPDRHVAVRVGPAAPDHHRRVVVARPGRGDLRVRLRRLELHDRTPPRSPSTAAPRPPVARPSCCRPAG